MAKSTKKKIKKEPEVVLPESADNGSVDETFSPKQMEQIQKMMDSVREESKSKDDSFSVYGARDPKNISHVKVSMFDGKFVIGYKDFQTNPYSQDKRYYQEKTDTVRKLANQPFVTLLLSNDGENVEEKEVSLIDYMNHRNRIELPVEKVSKKEVIDDHGVLGKVGAGMAQGIDGEGKVLSKNSVKAESKRLDMKFYVKLPDAEKAIAFTEDFLA